MDIAYTPEEHAFRMEVRAWLTAHVPQAPLPSFDTAAGFEQHRQWERTLNSGRWSAVNWPVEYGGRGVTLLQWLIFEEEYYRAGAPGRVNQNGIFLLGPTLMEFGTPEQKARYLPRMAAGEEVWAQGWSEPNAGSDMAAIRASARQDGDHYVINGQKTWCSRGAFADWLFGIFRTDPKSERHHGLTFILVPLDAPGVTVRPIAQLDGETGFAEVFFDDARVAAENRLGPENQGWKVAMATAGFERGLMLRSPARYQHTARKLVELYRTHAGAAGNAAGTAADPCLRDAVARAWLDAESYALNTYWTVSRLRHGGSIGAEASLNKIVWSELDLHMHESALALLGPHAELRPAIDVGSGGPLPPFGRAQDRIGSLQASKSDPLLDEGSVGDWLDGFLFALAGPIYAGTNEIQRNVIAERLLKLPKG